MQEIIYPISLDYVPTWGTWEVVRELISNAKDTGSKYRIEKINGNLILEDSGNGLAIRQLLLGVSEKENKNAIGQFGEGLKLSILVLTRLGKRIEIESGNLKINNSKDLIDGIEVLKLQYTNDNKTYNGTKITIFDWEDDLFSNRFLDLDADCVLLTNKYGSIVEPESEPNLFVKTVFTSELKDYEFSYNLNDCGMNRDRSSVDDWSVCREIGNVWSEVKDEYAWQEFFLAVKAGKKEKMAAVSLYKINSDEVKTAMIRGFTMVFGKDAVISSSEENSLEAKHRGAKIIEKNMFGDCLSQTLSELIGTDKKFVEEKLGSKAFKVPLSNLTPEQKNNFSIIKKIAKKLHYDSSKITIAKMEYNFGEADIEKGTMKISPVALENTQQAISTFLHEYAHIEYDTRDLTDDHVNACTKSAASVIISLMKLQ